MPTLPLRRAFSAGNRPSSVCVGSRFYNPSQSTNAAESCGCPSRSSGYIFKVYGFGYIEELKLLQEAGFHPLEVSQAATLNGAEALGMADEIGSVAVRKRAALVVVEENFVANFKVLYGTDAIRVNQPTETVRVGGVRYTIKDGIVFDAKKLLEDIRDLVTETKREAGRKTLKQSGR